MQDTCFIFHQQVQHALAAYISKLAVAADNHHGKDKKQSLYATHEHIANTMLT